MSRIEKVAVVKSTDKNGRTNELVLKFVDRKEVIQFAHLVAKTGKKLGQKVTVLFASESDEVRIVA